MTMRCLIIDDEPLARKGMEEYVREVTFLQHCGSFDSAVKAGVWLTENTADLLLLDIRMPRLSGIEFLKSLKQPPLVIFTTAYPEHALEGYELDIIDYLVKPISFERFLKAVQKAREFFFLRQKATTPDAADYFFIKCNQKFEKVNYSDLLYVEAMQNYCIVHVPGRKLITYITFGNLLEKLPVHRFLKVHKSYIISLDKVTSVDGNEILIGTSRIPISRNLKEEVLARIMGNNLFKR
jgi:DNA-binding LytR/AlgR family response regulator